MITILFLLTAFGTCWSCNCNLTGTQASLAACNYEECVCKPSVDDSSRCETCYDQFYNLSAVNVYGCERCSCDLGGAASQSCDEISGECKCKPGLGGRDCDRPASGQYVPSLYHIKGNLVVGKGVSSLKVSRKSSFIGIIEPKDIVDVPPKFKILLSEFPIPVSLSKRGKGKLKTKKRKRRRKLRKHRSLLETLPITMKPQRHIAKREELTQHTTSLEFPRAATYFLVLNYSSDADTEFELELSDLSVPVSVSKCKECLIMASGNFGVKGIRVGAPGSQPVTILTKPSTVIHYIVALPKEYYFTTSLKQDVSPRCSVGPFTELCNKYSYPEILREYNVAQAEDWLYTTSHPAYTDFNGVNLYGSSSSSSANPSPDNNVFRPTNQLKLWMKLIPGQRYYVVLQYYRPYHYKNFQKTYYAKLSFGVGLEADSGNLEILPCPWSIGCRSVSASDSKQLKSFKATTTNTYLNIFIDDDYMVFVDSVILISDLVWSWDVVQPRWKCVFGPSGECLESDFIDLTEFVFYESESAIDAYKLTLKNVFYHGTGLILQEPKSPSLSLVLMENIIPATDGEEYVVVVHYYKHTPNKARGCVEIYDENNGKGDLWYEFCPSVSGCRVAGTVTGAISRAVTSHNPSLTGQWSSFKVTGGNVRIIIRLSLLQADSVYIDYLALVPVKDFNVDMLFPLPFNHGPIFTQYCAYHYLYFNPDAKLEQYCKKTAFSMSTLFYNGTQDCDCSSAGSLSEVCDQVSGQCQCKEGYTGRSCNTCSDGFHSYPICLACNCYMPNSHSNVCDKESGQCLCKDSHSGLTCNECPIGTFGYNEVEDKLECDLECGCDELGSRDVSCDKQTGQCICKEGIAGITCNQCDASSYQYPACFDCGCHGNGTVDDTCDVYTGYCECQDGYTGINCDECVESYYKSEGLCVPCACGGSPCSSQTFFATHVLDDISDGVTSYRLTDITGGEEYNNRLLFLRFLRDFPDNNEILMVDMTDDHSDLYINLPELFVGQKLVAPSQSLSYDLILVAPPRDDFAVRTEVVFEGIAHVLTYKDVIVVTAMKTKDVVHNIKIKNSIQFTASANWRFRSSNDSVTDSDIRRVTQNLQNILINTRVHEDQLVAMIDNIKLEYVTTEAVSSEALEIPVCDCSVGYEGNTCEYCQAEYYRSKITENCDVLCDCNNNSRVCTDLGVCLDCENNSTGDKCEDCVAGFYKNGTNCVPCPCSSNSLLSCAIGTDGNVECSECDSGYSGLQCKECGNGYYKVSETRCAKCPCNDNLNLSLPDACDVNTGRCIKCKDSVIGEFCDMCAPGYHGNARLGDCTPCACHVDGAVSNECDESGKCDCHVGIGGDKCNVCKPGQYVSKNNMCEDCQCSVENAESDTCNSITGQCPCLDTYGGRQCTECEEGYFHFNVNSITSTLNCLPCFCKGKGVVDAKCRDDGSCYCKPGYEGSRCTSCDDDVYHLLLSDGTCEVCTDCPVILLKQIDDIRDTMDEKENSALLQNYTNELDKISDEADRIYDSIPDIDDLENLKELLDTATDHSEKVNKEVKDLEKRISNTDLDDIMDDLDDAENDVDNIEDFLKGTIDDIRNFNLDSTTDPEAVDTADRKLAEIRGNDISDEVDDIEDTFDYVNYTAAKAKDVLEGIGADIPDLDPLPQRLEKISYHLTDVNDSISDVSDDIVVLELELLALKEREQFLTDEKVDLRNNASDIEGDVIAATEMYLDSQDTIAKLPKLNLQPMIQFIRRKESDISKLNPLIQVREFDCEKLRNFKNVTGDDEGPKFINAITKYMADIDDIRQYVNNTAEAALNATSQANEYADDVAAAKKNLDDVDADPETDELGKEADKWDKAISDGKIANDKLRDRLNNLEPPTVEDRNIEDAPEVDLDIPDVEILEKKIDAIKEPPPLFNLTDKIPELKDKLDKGMGNSTILIRESLNIDYKLRSLQDKIEKAKRIVVTILIPMKFTGKDSYAEYPYSLEKSAYTTVKATFNVEDTVSDAGILSLQHQPITSSGDYIDLKIVDERVVADVQVDNARVTLNHTKKIEPNSWNTVILHRIGNYITLGGPDESTVTETLGATGAININNLIIGNAKNIPPFHGAVTDVFINDDRVPQWLFEDAKGINRSMRANRYIKADKGQFNFNGDTSYLAYNTPLLRGNRITSLKFKTASKDGLLMFHADGEGKNMSLFAVDLYEGEVRLHYADNGQVVTQKAPPQSGEQYADLTEVSISSYLSKRPGRPGRWGIIAKNSRFLGPIDAGLDLKAQVEPTYIGKVPKRIEEKYSELFETDVVTSKPFIGCIWDININKQSKRLSLKTARKVKNGCYDKVLRSASIQNGGYMKLRSPLKWSNVSFVLATSTTHGTIFYKDNNRGDYLLVAVDKSKLVIKYVVEEEEYILQSKANINTKSRRFVTITVTPDNRMLLHVDDIVEDSTVIPYLADLSSGEVYLGQLPDTADGPSTGYVGCITDLVIGQSVTDFVTDIVEQENVILDRCRVIKAKTTEVELDDIIMEPVRVAQCYSLQANPLTDSFFLSEGGNNHIRVKKSLFVNKFKIAMTVRTRASEGVLVFIHSTERGYKYVLLHFNSTTLIYDVNFGEGLKTSITLPAKLGDGIPHKVTVARSNNRFLLNLDNLDKPGDIPNDGLAVFRNSEPIYIGIIAETAEVSGVPFTGCISGLQVDTTNFTRDMVETVGHVPSCVAATTPTLNHYFNGSVHFSPDVTLKADDTITLEFLSVRQTGDILSLVNENKDNILKVTLDNGKVTISTTLQSLDISVSEENLYFCDGSYHTLTLDYKTPSSVTVTVDKVVSRDVSLSEDNLYVVIGDQFTGCMTPPTRNSNPISLSSLRSNTGVQFASCPA